MANFELIHTSEEYRDFEPISGIEYAGYARITFDDNKHTAYGTKVNPLATPNNTEPTFSDETIPLTWDEALKLVGRDYTSHTEAINLANQPRVPDLDEIPTPQQVGQYLKTGTVTDPACDHCEDTQKIDGEACGWCVDVAYTLPKITQDALPKFCPYCGGTNITDIQVQWASVSENQDTDTLDEYQCVDEDNRSFWA